MTWLHERVITYNFVNFCTNLTKKFNCLLSYLLKPYANGSLKSVDALMPMIGARFYTQLDSTQLWGDMVEGEIEKVKS